MNDEYSLGMQMSIFASGGQGGFFEKSPPWTPQKTFDLQGCFYYTII